MQPLLLMKQTLESSYNPAGAFKFDGPNAVIGSLRSSLSIITSETRARQLMVEFITDDGQKLALAYIPDSSSAARIARMSYSLGTGPEYLTVRAKGGGWEVGGSLVEGTKKMLPAHFQAFPDRCFLLVGQGVRNNGEIDGYDIPFEGSNAPFRKFLLETLHLPGLRRDPTRPYPNAAIGKYLPGVFHDYFASIILAWQESQADELGHLQDAASRMGLTAKVEARAVDPSSIEIKVGRMPTTSPAASDSVSIGDVGLGVSQALPILVALYACRPGGTVYIEQPELHLHPAAQVRMARLLAEAAKRGVRVIAETHSSLLLTEVQTLVATGELSPDLVKLHWFERDLKSGHTKVTSADLDQNGAFGGWPVDFDEVLLDSQGRYLDAVSLRGG